VDDVRDLNRGYTTDEEASLPQSKTIYQTLATIFKTRLCFPELSTTIPTHESSAIPSVLSLQYTMSNDSLLVFINLKNEEVIIPCAEAGAIILAINGAKLSNTQVVLPPYAGIWIKLNKTSSTI
jgi:hypothetical protein